MADKNKVYVPEVIEDQPVPALEADATLEVTQKTSNEVYGAQKIEPQRVQRKFVAQELIGQALNTKSRRITAPFEFTQSGALQIGKYEDGVSGDMKLSPAGIVARNRAGLTTFAIDAETGDAVFRGSVQSGSVITGDLLVGGGNVVIDGENKQILVFDANGLARILIGFHENGF